MCALTRIPESSELLRGELPGRRYPGGTEDVRGAIDVSTNLKIAIWNCGGLSNVNMEYCNELGYDILALMETHGRQADPNAIYTDTPLVEDRYAGCCFALSKRVRRAVMYTGALESRLIFACIRGLPTN